MEADDGAGQRPSGSEPAGPVGGEVPGEELGEPVDRLLDNASCIGRGILKDADCQLDIGRKRCRITMDPGLTSQTTRRAHSFPTSRLTQWWSGIPPSQLKPDQEMDEVRVSGAGYRSGARN